MFSKSQICIYCAGTFYSNILPHCNCYLYIYEVKHHLINGNNCIYCDGDHVLKKYFPHCKYTLANYMFSKSKICIYCAGIDTTLLKSKSALSCLRLFMKLSPIFLTEKFVANFAKIFNGYHKRHRERINIKSIEYNFAW